MGTAANAAKKKYATGLSAVDLKLCGTAVVSGMFWINLTLAQLKNR
jgi:hypothetical protein